jgi:GMP synthase-like glutamine amidotransferase
MHRDIVTIPPSDAIVMGSNEKCANQVFIIPGRVLSVQGTDFNITSLNQGHPEFNQEIVEFILRNRFGAGLFGRDVYDEAFPHAADEDDGVEVAESIMKFVLGVKT